MWAFFIIRIAAAQVKTFDIYDWADNPQNYVGYTITIYAKYPSSKFDSYSGNDYVIYQKERSEGYYNKWGTEYTPARYYCYKKFKEYNTGKKIVVNIPQSFWNNDGAGLPKTYNGSYYKLVLDVTNSVPGNLCGDGWTSASDGKYNIYYTLREIERINN